MNESNLEFLTALVDSLTSPEGASLRPWPKKYSFRNSKNYSPEEIVIVTTGSQGEPLSALHRIAFSDHRQIEIIPGDMIIISSNPIPGNEKTVGNVVN